MKKHDERDEPAPVAVVPAAQGWLWVERWQAMEREADADIAAGRATVVNGLMGLISHLDGG